MRTAVRCALVALVMAVWLPGTAWTAKAGQVAVFATAEGLSKGAGRLPVGALAETRGFYTEGDGGGALYKIADKTEKPWDIALAKGKYASIANTDRVTYRMFGAQLDGKTDDEEAIMRAHTYANAAGARVENHSGIIWKGSPTQIPVLTDVDLSGSVLKVTDANAAFRSWYRIGDVRDVYYTLNFTPAQKAQLLEGTAYFTMLDNSLPANVVVRLEEKPFAARDDEGNVYPVNRAELLVHDMNGICTGPLIESWTQAGGRSLAAGGKSYTSVFKAIYTNIPSDRLVFTGCDVEIDTSANQQVNVVNINRHNTTVRDFTIRPHRDSLRNDKVFKSAVIYAEDSYNIAIENITGFNTAGQDGEARATSGYLVRLTGCMKATIRNCRLNGYWGATAMDNVKDVHVENSEANRIDIHHYFRDLFITNCQLYNRAVQVGYGKGLLSITNCTAFYQPIPDYSHPADLINLNTTYGRIFSGLITVDNVTMDIHAGNGQPNIVNCRFLPQAATLSVSPYKLPEIRARNLTANIYGAEQPLRFMNFSGSWTGTIENFQLASFENITSNRGLVLYVDATGGGIKTIGGARIALWNCPELDRNIGQWFGRADNDKPEISG